MEMQIAYFLQFSQQVQYVLRECNQHVPQSFTECRKFMDDDRILDKKSILKNLIRASIFYGKSHIIFLPIYMTTYDIGYYDLHIPFETSVSYRALFLGFIQ